MGKEIQALEYQSVNILCTATTYKYVGFLNVTIIPDEVIFSVQCANMDPTALFKITTDIVDGKQIGNALGVPKNVFDVRYILKKSICGTFTFWLVPNTTNGSTIAGGELICINMQFIKYK